MKSLTIYICSSWKNEHAVELLTRVLEAKGHHVHSFVREGIKPNEVEAYGGFEAWVWSINGEEKFQFDLLGATQSDLFIYLGPSGMDAGAGIGAAYASKVPILGLTAKGEQIGLMRRMIQWCDNLDHLLASVDAIAEGK